MLEGLTPPSKDKLCIVGREAANLSKEDLKIFLEAMDDQRWSSNALAEELMKRGFPAGRNAITVHRSKKCACAR